MPSRLRYLRRTKRVPPACVYDQVRQPIDRLAAALGKMTMHADLPTWLRDSIRTWAVAINRPNHTVSTPDTKYSRTPRLDECVYHLVGTAVRHALSMMYRHSNLWNISPAECRQLADMVTVVEQLADGGIRAAVVKDMGGWYCIVGEDSHVGG